MTELESITPSTSPDQIYSVPDFSITDFKSRWQKARLQVCARVLTEELSQNPNLVDPTEYELLALCTDTKKEELLKSVFDVSRQLAMSASRYFKVSFEIADLAKILTHSSSPCVGGSWGEHKEAYVYRRKACSDGLGIGSFACDYWREACDGLVMGLGEDERFARHASHGHGDNECMDILFVDKPVRTKDQQQGSSLKWLPLPTFLKKDLDLVSERMSRLRVKVDFLGYAESKVFYLLENNQDSSASLCGPGGRYFHEKLREEIAKLHPDLQIQDAAPLAVYGEKA